MSIIDKIGKKKAKTLELMNVTRISENILYTDDNRKMIYILVEPINMSVSSPLVIERRVDALKNVIVSVFFTSLCLGWLNSTSGCFLSYFFGFTSLVYLFGTYMLIKYVLKGSSLNK